MQLQSDKISTAYRQKYSSSRPSTFWQYGERTQYPSVAVQHRSRESATSTNINKRAIQTITRLSVLHNVTLHRTLVHRSSYYSARSHQPLTSSPLASPTYSPTHTVQERRRAQYKSTTSSSLHRTPTSQPFLSRVSNQTTPEDPQKVFLRERLQARCREHAQKLRDRAVSSRRRNSERYSDVFMDGDDDESDDVIMQDEVRVVLYRGPFL
ncbi:hypothetical protein JVU11DRAFT_7776 [Chiua virens]|nr:hypothetical protein JVU11DRAFT_7776 [Chiua virens]